MANLSQFLTRFFHFIRVIRTRFQPDSLILCRITPMFIKATWVIEQVLPRLEHAKDDDDDDYNDYDGI